MLSVNNDFGQLDQDTDLRDLPIGCAVEWMGSREGHNIPMKLHLNKRLGCKHLTSSNKHREGLKPQTCVICL